ncbi:flagellar biosynthesis protein FlhB [Maricaulis salignorans]|uniref:Flagellar biosynthetic protein FlhB n=1 Tax=Maricaulis salignorans TaxID=144026 RepID=A0A1G9VK17_9PROT|nr:flagellar biosynthesis protein FlhB [Maricaulis salignorans]SDM72165.1 flagellar biosynthetic protein FlhB [Maricaulis salignorans]
MAEGEDESQKTEEPTQKKLDDAREKGDVAKSQEIPGWFILAAGLALLSFIFPSMARNLAGALVVYLEQPDAFAVEPHAVLSMMRQTAWHVAVIVGVPILVLAGAGFAGHYLQQGMIFTTEKMQPKLSKINPVEGFKRVFGPQGVANFLKGIGKMALVGLAVFVVLFPKRDLLAGMPALDVSDILVLVRQISIELMLACLVVYAMIAAADFAFQKQSFMKRNRMSKQEIKDEHKNSEGDPHVKAKLRQLRHERSQRRMMARVPEATVIITNPTHYAVALLYEQGKTSAPICLALGVDEVALRIREMAKEHDIPIVEDPPLARALFATAELDQEIPVDHFKAVAKIIGYVLSLSRGRAQYAPSE